MTRSPLYAAAVVLFALLACKKQSPEARKKDLEARRSWLKKAGDSFRAMHSGMATRPGSKEVKCPDTQIATNIKQLAKKSSFMPTVDYAFLGRFVDANTPVDEKQENPWEFLTSLQLRPLVHHTKMPTDYRSRDLSDRSKALFAENAYVLVFKSTKKTLPKIEEGEDWYDPGVWHGYVGVFDLAQSRYVCNTFIATENESEIVEDDEGLFQETYEESAMDDLREQIAKRTERRLGRVSSELRSIHLL